MIKLEEPTWLKEDYAALVKEWRQEYSIAISKMERWAQKELDYIRHDHTGRGEGSTPEQFGRRRALELDELNTLLRLHTIRIAKHYANEAGAKIRDVNSILYSIDGYKAILKFGIDTLKTLSEPDCEGEFQTCKKKAEKEEALLKEGNTVLEAFENEMYGQLEKFTPLKA